MGTISGMGFAQAQVHTVHSTSAEIRQLTLMDEMERLMCNFHYWGYYCSPNLFIHQNSTQELTLNFLVTLGLP